MMIFAVVFFVPQALLFAELGSAFPQEGGPYYWTRLAFGHLAGAVNNFLYWITNPVWIGGSLTITCIAAVQVFFNHGANVSTPVWFIIALAFVWLSILAAIMSFSKAKWLPTAGAFARFIVLGMSPSRSSSSRSSMGRTAWTRAATSCPKVVSSSSSACCCSTSSASSCPAAPARR